MDFTAANTHELSHRIDSMFVHSAENEAFHIAIQDAKSVFEGQVENIVDYCVQNDKDGFLSDIMDAICESKHLLPMRHGAEYWKKQGVKEKEIFANLYSLQVFQDEEKLNFLNKYFKEVMIAFEMLEP